MSVQSEISRLESAKTKLKTAIEGKGVTVPESAKLDGYAALVEQISGGGGSKGGRVHLTYDKGGGQASISITIIYSDGTVEAIFDNYDSNLPKPVAFISAVYNLFHSFNLQGEYELFDNYFYDNLSTQWTHSIAAVNGDCSILFY